MTAPTPTGAHDGVTIPRHEYRVEGGCRYWGEPISYYVGVCSCGFRILEYRSRVAAENEMFSHAEYWNRGIKP